MCGIVGFTGNVDAKKFLLDGLTKLEYRGYDSAGIAVIDGNGDMDVVCRVGKVAQLTRVVKKTQAKGSCGIGHTRWATHGIPNEANAHPHCDCTGKIAIVHNGIVENFAQLREQLEAEGHVFLSETDTEIAAHLVEKYYEGDLAAAVRETIAQLEGAYGLAVIHADHPGDIVVTRKDSPIVVGSSVEGAFVASDTPAIISHTREVVYLNDGDIAILHEDGSIDFTDAQGASLKPEITHIDWDAEAAERGGYPDFMLKEINEQPRVVRDTIAGRVDKGIVIFDELKLSESEIDAIDRIYIIACGTSYHAGLIAKNVIESWARIPVDVEVSSEFRYRDPIVTPSTLVIAITQSGETADTLAAIRLARAQGAKVVSVTNVVGSRVTRESDSVIYIKANLEISVAATKSFLAQASILMLLAMFLAQKRHQLSAAQINVFYREMQELSAQIESILANTEQIERCAKACIDAHSALFIGRGMGSAICYEGALKLKEISYLHAEAYPAGEIKHGPIALIDQNMPVIVVATQSITREKTISNIQEVRARGAKVIAIATEGDKEITHLTDCVIFIPAVRECFSPITASVPLQLFARSIAVARGCDVDQPRNLAKSVTVE